MEYERLHICAKICIFASFFPKSQITGEKANHKKQLQKQYYKSMRKFFLTISLIVMGLLPMMAADPAITFENAGELNTLVRIHEQKHYILLPIEEHAPELWVRVLYNNREADKLNIRLAQNTVDYFVPFDLSNYDVKNLALDVRFNDNRISRRNGYDWMQQIQLSDEFDATNIEKYRPAFHHTPAYGWMNDPNGMFYDPKTGIWHLYFQYNPYGSTWQNMTWGHSESTDLLHWTYKGLSIVPNGLGSIFSGSCVIDHNNTAGFGEDAVIALYTSAGEYQSQSLAYSYDGGNTFTPYAANPILTAELPDFRDPNMFWNEDTKEWNLVMACDQEMRFYSSPNLINWKFESAFGKGRGNHEGVWECPDLFKLKIENGAHKGETKWVLLCNINPGGPFGGSATQYFVGDWDGHHFTCAKYKNEENKEEKWLDYGMDHYATVSFSGAPEGRTTVVAWMSNWLYANDVPTMQFRSANSLPRDLHLYEGKNGELYVGVRASKECEALRGERVLSTSLTAGKKASSYKLKMPGVVDITIKNKDAEAVSFTLSNANAEKVVMTYNLKEGTFTTDRIHSGKTSFSGRFATATTTPIYNKIGKETKLTLYIDNCSVEVFGDDTWCQTNLVFPTMPYNHISVSTDEGSAAVTIKEYGCK